MTPRGDIVREASDTGFAAAVGRAALTASRTTAFMSTSTIVMSNCCIIIRDMSSRSFTMEETVDLSSPRLRRICSTTESERAR